MTKDDTQKFTKLLVGVAEVLGRGEISAAAQRLWFEALRDYPFTLVDKAFTFVIGDPDRKKFFPDPSDIVRQIEGTSTEKAMIAWNIVSKCGCDAYSTVIFEDPIIHQVIHDMGGWITFQDPGKWSKFTNADGELSGYTDTQFNFFRKEFLDRYTTLLKTGAPNAPQKMIGIVEMDNRLNFPEHVPEPVRITHDGRKLLPEYKPKYILTDGSAIGADDKPASAEEVKKLISDMTEKFKDKPF
jgi:hypothetical protein